MYKQTAEYVFDLLEHEYMRHYDIINQIGVDNIMVCIPSGLKENLKAIEKFYFPVTGEHTINMYPTEYRNMHIVFLDIDDIMFALK